MLTDLFSLTCRHNMPVKGLIIFSFYQKKEITEQVYNDAAANTCRRYL